MKNLTILFSSFKKALENCPEIKVVECRSQFDPPSAARKRHAIAELEEEGYDVAEWLGPIITLSKGNSINYLMLSSNSKGGGAFSLNNPEDYLLESEIWLAKMGKDEAAQNLLKSARAIDQPDIAQTFTAVICSKGSPPKLPEKLIYFRRGAVLEMQIPFSQYCEHLAHFFGFYNWQLLFTDEKPSQSEFKQDFLTLVQGYHDFTRLFPSFDFSIWKERLQAKGLL